MLKHLDGAVLNNLTQSELTTLRYIDSHKKEVVGMSIQKLSKKIFISTATILRLCKKMNFTGYSELKYALKNSLSENRNQNTSEKSELSALSDTFQVIDNTCRLLDPKALETITGFLLSDKKIHLYGGGLSTPVLEYMQRFLLSAGRPCFFYSTAPLTYRAAEKMNENDVILIGSSSGATPSVTRIAQISKNSKATIVAITNLDGNPLSQLADISLFTLINNRDYYGTEIKSRASMFFIVDTILECYLFRLTEQNPDFITETRWISDSGI